MEKKKGARAKLREHFLTNVGKVMNSDELREIAGEITEWARRVRELSKMYKTGYISPLQVASWAALAHLF